MKGDPDGPDFTTCCSQIFDPDGTGFRFVAYAASEFTQDRNRNPYLSYYEMQSVLSRSLEVYQTGHAGRTPRKVTVHKNAEFKEDEILGAGVLGLTKMDWNNNALYKKLPATLVYSSAFANIVQQNPNIVDSVYDFRCFM